MPAWDVATLIGLGVPLYLVTMASQNLPGFAVLRASGYQPPTQPVLAVTGAASLGTAFLGAHTSNLAAISAALCTGPEAHPDPAKRWMAGVFYALWWGLVALFGASLVGLFAALAAGAAGHGRRHGAAGLDGERHGRRRSSPRRIASPPPARLRSPRRASRCWASARPSGAWSSACSSWPWSAS